MKAAWMLVATALTWGTWTALGEDNAKAVWYVDPASIRAEGGVRQVWALKDMVQPVTDFDLVHAVPLRGRLHGAAAWCSTRPTRAAWVAGTPCAAGCCSAIG